MFLHLPLTRVLRDGWSALHISAKKNHTDMAQLLLQHGIDVDAKKKCDRTYA